MNNGGIYKENKLNNTIVNIHANSGNTEWYTPWAIIECARELMGGIDLDPFSCRKANERPEGRVAEDYYTAHCGSLDRSWYGNVWMNHPFGRTMNEDCVAKIVYEYIRINPTMEQACCITFASTSEKWFKPLLRYPQFYFTGRTNYLDSETLQPVKGVTKGSVITFFPPRGWSYRAAVGELQRVFRNKFEGEAK